MSFQKPRLFLRQKLAPRTGDRTLSSTRGCLLSACALKGTKEQDLSNMQNSDDLTVWYKPFTQANFSTTSPQTRGDRARRGQLSSAGKRTFRSHH